MNLLHIFSKAIAILMLLTFLHGTNRTIAQHFVRNVGQVTTQNFEPRIDIDFKLSAAPGLNVFIGTGKVHYQFIKLGADSNFYDLYRLDMELLGANPNASVHDEHMLRSYERFYTLGLDGAKALHSKKVTYRNIYPKIDLTFYFTNLGQLEYDFILHPGANPKDIVIRYSGAQNIAMTPIGSLTVKTPLGTVVENAPVAYQQEDKKSVGAKFLLRDSTISFSVANYQGTLILDPILEWATYFGGSEYDAIMDMTRGKDGKIYAVGNTNSLSNIATTGAHQITYGGGSNPNGADAFLAKYDTAGLLLWATYYGGANVDQGTGITTDTFGNIYTAGRTNSAQNIATLGVHQDTKAGTAAGYDAYLTKFDTAGTRIWGTYFGGPGAEGSQTIVLTSDRKNNIYLAGNTASTSGIATAGAHQQSRSGTSDGFLAKFNNNGQLDWGTYIGGTSIDAINALTTDMAGNIYLIGNTNSMDGIATIGTHQISNAGGTDAFIMKFNDAGNRLWGTYWGGAAYEEGTGIVADSFGHLYITGSTESTTGISTANAHQTTYGGGSSDIFFSKLNASSGTVGWSTYYGGTGNDVLAKPIVGKNGMLLLTGTSTSTNNISTPDAIMPIHAGDGKLIVAIFDTSGTRQWGTYLGGNLSELNTAGILTGENNLYLTGYTNSSNGLSTSGAFQPVFGGNHDGYLMKVDLCFQPHRPDTILGKIQICANTPYTYHIDAVNGATAYRWIVPSGWTGSSDSSSIAILTNGSGNLKVVAINACGGSDTTSLAIDVLPAPEPVINRTGSILTAAQTYSAYQWNKDGQPISGANLPTLVVTSNGLYTLTATASNGCEGTSKPLDVINLSVDDFTPQLMKIYPNPVTETLFIQVDFNADLEIFDAAGRKQKSIKLNNGSNTISLEHLQNGVYFLRMKNTLNGQESHAKLIKAE